LKYLFGEQPEKLEWAARRLGGTEVPGDVGIRISFLPKVKISFTIWEGDDDRRKGKFYLIHT